MCELWLDVLGYENEYQVSNTGKIKSKSRTAKVQSNADRTVSEKQRKLFLNKRGYVTVVLSKNGILKTFTVHQLVAQAFMPNFIKSNELNHIDGNKENNNISNLELSNPSHNQFHAVTLGLRSKDKKSSKFFNVSYINNPNAVKKWAVCIKHAGKSSFGWKTFLTELEAAQYADELLDSIGDTNRPRNFPKTP